MTVTVGSLQGEYPEFVGIDATVVAAKLAQAKLELNTAAIPTDSYDTVVGLLTADKIARSPHGVMAGLSTISDETVYYKEYLRLIKRYGRSYRVMGGVSS